jgi:hypothetical protein
VVGFCEDGNEHADCITGRQFMDQLSIKLLSMQVVCDSVTIVMYH